MAKNTTKSTQSRSKSGGSVRKGLGEYQDWRSTLENTSKEQAPSDNIKFSGMKGNEFSVGMQNPFDNDGDVPSGKVEAVEGNIKRMANDGRVQLTKGNNSLSNTVSSAGDIYISRNGTSDVSQYNTGAANMFKTEKNKDVPSGKVEAVEGNINKMANDGRVQLTKGNNSLSSAVSSAGDIYFSRNGTADVNQYNTGVANRFKAEKNKLAELTYETVKNQYAETEAKQGKVTIDKAARFVGHGGIYKTTAKSDLANKLYNRDQSTLPSDNIINSGRYRLGNSHTGNVLNDYHNNMNFIVRELDKSKINITKLNGRQINAALRTGEITSFGRNVKLTKEQIELVKEYSYLKRLEGSAKQIGNSKGRRETITDAFTDATIGDTDFKQGLDFTKKTLKTTKITANVGREAVNMALKGGVNTVSLGSRAVTGMTRVQYNAIYRATGNTKAKAIADKAASLNTSIKNGTVKVTDGIQKVTHADKHVKNRVNSAVDNFKLKHLKWLTNLQDKVLNNRVARIIRKPFSVFNALKRAVFKGTVFIGLAIGIIFILVPMLAMVISSVPDIMDYNPANGETIMDTTAQKAINYLYSFQEAYTENTFECRTDTEQGRIWAEKRLPESWFDQIKGTDSTIINENNNASVYYDGEIAGFNFNRYWGQRAWKEGGGEDSYGNVPVYVTAVSDSWPVGGDDGYTDYETHTVTLKFYGNAGLMGDIGEYEMPYSVYDCYMMGIDELEFNINGNKENPGTEETEAYTLWESDDYVNPDVDCTFTYMGSKYSFTYTGGKYSYYYDTEGTKQTYTIDDFYKSFLTIVMGFSDNGEEDAEFVTLYAKEVFDAVMENATVSMHYEYEKEEKDENLTMKVNSPDGDFDVSSNDYYNCNVYVDVIINDSGLMDLMYQDATLECTERDGTTWTHNGEVGNEWVHSSHAFYNIENATYEEVSGVKSKHAYKQTNPDSPKGDYVAWYNESQGEGVTPLWGMTKDEYEDRSNLSTYTFYDGVERTYPVQMKSMIEAYNFSVEDWESFVEGLMFPSGWARMLSDGEIIRTLQEARENGLNTDDYEDYEEAIQFILQTIGKFGYFYGAHAGNWDEYNGNRFDCSGYISYILQATGKIPKGSYYTAGSYVDSFSHSTYEGDIDSLKPGDLVVKNHGYGTTKSSDNHVAIFVGYLQLDGDTKPQPYFAECTSGRNGKKGSMLTKASAFNNYDYRVTID